MKRNDPISDFQSEDIQRSRWARHGVDLERDRQGGGRLEPGAAGERIAAGLPTKQLVTEELPLLEGQAPLSNSDPVTG